MSKKKDQEPVKIQQNIIYSPMEEVMHNSMIPYAEHVIMERAVPRVEDGLKPVQRRILYTMSELALWPDTPHRKCARIVGDCLGKFHPHGDSSVYDALVRLSQDFSMRAPLVDGHGNFGSIDGDSAAAMRYTEARMTPLAIEMLKDLEKNTVPYRLNFDDTLKEPDMLPASFPNLLVNGSSGIAVGLATNIPPHNLRECVNAVIAQIDNPDITLEELMEIMPAPDFPTGGVLLNTPEIKNAYATGKGKLHLRAKTHIEDGPAGRKLIVITEVPYVVNKAAMLEKILKLTEDKKAALGCIYDIRDESDRTGMRAVVELRKEADVDKVLAYLYKYSEMQVTFGVNMVAIADGKPKLLSLKRIIRYYIKHRKSVITARTEYDLEKAKARAHVLEGLMIAVDNLDEVIALIRRSENPKAAKLALMARFDLSEVQAQAILDMRLQRLTGLEILSLQKEYADLLAHIASLEAILANVKKLMTVIKKELRQVADKYGDDRRTQIVDAENAVEAIAVEDFIAEEAMVTYSRAGLLRRMYPKQYKKLSAAGNDGTVDDQPMFCFETLTDRTLFFFTNLGNCYTIKIADLPEMNKPKDRGSLLSGVLAGLEENEVPMHIHCAKIDELKTSFDLLFVTKLGQFKRSVATEYDVRRQKFAALNLRAGDSLLMVMPIDPKNDLLVVTASGMSIRFHADDLPQQGRIAGGVKGVSLEAGDQVLWCGQPDATDQLLLMSERGFAKRVLFMDFDPQSRGGKGVKSFYFNKSGSNGSKVAGALLVKDAAMTLLVAQKLSDTTTLTAQDIVIQGKQGKGSAYVMAIMDDVVTGIEKSIQVDNLKENDGGAEA
ncbi:MAG: DNA topoisomerase (ATP-hydrolyzing) subunit A [Clostridiales bacterium]|nr:DNA topoisomerase (ATP-hydrolyzing) subunit A [Clostridiales bacterium]